MSGKVKQTLLNIKLYKYYVQDLFFKTYFKYLRRIRTSPSLQVVICIRSFLDVSRGYFKNHPVDDHSTLIVKNLRLNVTGCFTVAGIKFDLAVSVVQSVKCLFEIA